MLSYEQALAIIEANIQALTPASVPTGEAVGWVTAEELNCETAVPPFDNSAMDGFALIAADTAAASDTMPVRLAVSGTVLAGDSGSAIAAAGSVHEIMTGAAVPGGYDAVVPVERVTIERDATGKPESVIIAEPVEAGANLRRAGEDFKNGDLLLSPGQVVDPNQVMGLAATGVESINARRKPTVVAITTGNELTDAGELERGMIHDSNGPYLAAAIPELGAECVGVYRTGDAEQELIQLVEEFQDKVDVIVSTGGVSAGRMDFVPRALELMGADILFHRVAIRPGKPALFARLPNGTWFFGLPGNPIAVAVGLRFFVTPALRLLRGLPAEELRYARLAAPVQKKPGLSFFAKARVDSAADGSLVAEILPGQESFKIKPLMTANCWVIVPTETDQLDAGAIVKIADMATT